MTDKKQNTDHTGRPSSYVPDYTEEQLANMAKIRVKIRGQRPETPEAKTIKEVEEYNKNSRED